MDGYIPSLVTLSQLGGGGDDDALTNLIYFNESLQPATSPLHHELIPLNTMKHDHLEQVRQHLLSPCHRHKIRTYHEAGGGGQSSVTHSLALL